MPCWKCNVALETALREDIYGKLVLQQAYPSTQTHSFSVQRSNRRELDSRHIAAIGRMRRCIAFEGGVLLTACLTWLVG
jgi:hypothetical protein